MEKVIIRSPGGYEKLELQECEGLSPGANEVVVEVMYSGVNYADVCVRWGIYESAKKFVGWPITPGFEFSGVVKEVGSHVESFKVGDEVFGVSLFDSYASEVCVVKEQLFKKPKHLSFEQAACFPAVFMTAYHALFQLFIFRKNSRVLVHSAAGGVGSTLVQLAKWHGCHVTGVVGSSHKIAHLQALGADEIIDKSCESLWKRADEISSDGFDVVLDANGVKTLEQSFKRVAPTGKLIVYGFHTMLPKASGRINWIKLAFNYLRTPRFNPIDLTSANKSVMAFNLSFLFERRELLNEAINVMLELSREGIVQAPVVKTFKASDEAKAHQLIESGASVGKIALSWSKE